MPFLMDCRLVTELWNDMQVRYKEGLGIFDICRLFTVVKTRKTPSFQAEVAHARNWGVSRKVANI